MVGLVQLEGGYNCNRLGNDNILWRLSIWLGGHSLTFVFILNSTWTKSNGYLNEIKQLSLQYRYKSLKNVCTIRTRTGIH